jgi:hypothetical protein
MFGHHNCTMLLSRVQVGSPAGEFCLCSAERIPKAWACYCITYSQAACGRAETTANGCLGLGQCTFGIRGGCLVRRIVCLRTGTGRTRMVCSANKINYSISIMGSNNKTVSCTARSRQHQRSFPSLYLRFPILVPLIPMASSSSHPNVWSSQFRAGSSSTLP